MRPVGLGDLAAAAGALAAVAPERRRALMALMLTEAEAADAFRRREGRVHPGFGNGTLMSAALTRQQAKPPAGDPQGLALLALALEAVLDRQRAICRQGAGKSWREGYL